MDRNGRLIRILEEADTHGEVKVSVLAGKLQVSEMTIRKDLNYLCGEKHLKRTYGGAEKCAEHFYKRNTRNDVFIKAASKITLAKAACQEISEGDTVLMDGSSTCVYLARMIKERNDRQLHVVTNSILVAGEILEASHVKLTLLGGNVQKNQAVTEGEAVLAQLREQRTRLCFLSPNGIDPVMGVTVVDYEQMRIKREMIRHSEKTCILADRSKLGKSFASRICDMQDLWKIILSCDGGPEERKRLKDTLPDHVDVV